MVRAKSCASCGRCAGPDRICRPATRTSAIPACGLKSTSSAADALLNTASGATWVSIRHGGGVGVGYSQHAGMVVVCDGTADAAERIARVLWNDPASGVMRHTDAGYEIAEDCAREHGLKPPMKNLRDAKPFAAGARPADPDAIASHPQRRPATDAP